MIHRLFLILAVSLLSLSLRAEEVVLVEGGAARCAIYLPPEFMEPDRPFTKHDPYQTRVPETHRRRLRDSVLDLSQTLRKLSGAEVPIHTRPPREGEVAVPLLVGEYARQRFGEPKVKTAQQQGWRLSITPGGIGLQGETPEGASYAIYEVLARLGCRWYLPGDLGEVLPEPRPTLKLAGGDTSSAPRTAVRELWYADDAFRRRNRLGGSPIECNHVLEGYITEAQREAHPEWRAIIGGKPHKTRLKWSHPEVAEAVADAIIAKLDKAYAPSISIAPGDGSAFDESEDPAMDAGDWDAASGTYSITDRYIAFCNRVVEKVVRKYPEVRFGFLAYVQYTRPPIREKPHPNLVPEIAPINYCRAHTFHDGAACPSRAELKEIVEGWAKVCREVIYYPYLYHLAEVTAPFPMLRQLRAELPDLYRNHVLYWQPETLSNFEQVLPGMWLSLRMAWETGVDPERELAEFYTRFYGAAARPMQRYWEWMDDAWAHPPLHAGSFWSYNRRFTPQVLETARGLMNEALAAASGNVLEYRRVQMQNEALQQLERLMAMKRDLNEGRLKHLDLRATEWQGTQMGLANAYAENFAFSKAGWTPRTVGNEYFHHFQEATLRDAARLAQTQALLSPPLRQWRYQMLARPDSRQGEAARKFDGVAEGKARGWHQPDFDASAWKETDSGLDTLADLGLANTFGTLWYRATVAVPKRTPGRKLTLWLAAVDGEASVYINGQPATPVGADGKPVEKAEGYAVPLAFEVPAAAQPGEPLHIAIAATRFLYLNELGTGGLLGPAYLFEEKPTP